VSLKIVISKDNKPIDQISMTADEATIGRRSECDISIKDPAVSGHHASLSRRSGKYMITDAGSTNGIYVKGRRVKEHILHHEDVVMIGEHQLRFLIFDAAQQTQVVDAGEARSARRGERGGSKEGPMGFLKVVGGSREGEQITLEEGLTKIGEPGVQVAAVSRRPQGYFLIHVDGGKDRERVPIVNGEPIGFKSRKLEPGDKVEVAGVEMSYNEL